MQSSFFIVCTFSSMTSSTTSIFFLLCVSLLIRDFSDCCTDSELVRGCRIATAHLSPNFQCLCGVGCDKEFPFKTRLECEASLKEGTLWLSSLVYQMRIYGLLLQNKRPWFSPRIGPRSLKYAFTIPIPRSLEKSYHSKFFLAYLWCRIDRSKLFWP